MRPPPPPPPPYPLCRGRLLGDSEEKEGEIMVGRIVYIKFAWYYESDALLLFIPFEPVSYYANSFCANSPFRKGNRDKGKGEGCSTGCVNTLVLVPRERKERKEKRGEREGGVNRGRKKKSWETK